MGFRVSNAHSGWPSTVLNETTRRPLFRETQISGICPKNSTLVTVAPRSLVNMPCHLRSELHEPPRIERGFSILQLHSIMSESSPFGFPSFPFRWTRPGTNSPNSKKIADPYPRQIWETRFAISA